MILCSIHHSSEPNKNVKRWKSEILVLQFIKGYELLRTQVIKEISNAFQKLFQLTVPIDEIFFVNYASTHQQPWTVVLRIFFEMNEEIPIFVLFAIV